MNVAIIYGGKSGEHKVSRISAASVVRQVKQNGHKILLIGITTEGEWFLQKNAEEKLCAGNETSLILETNTEDRVFVVPGAKQNCFRTKDEVFSVDVVFPVLHGTYGEDGTIQGLFEMAQIPYVGGGVLASSVSMDKEKTKLLWQEARLPIVPFVAIKDSQWNNQEAQQAIIEKAERDLMYPIFIKPACAGSSVGAAKASNREEFLKQAKEAFRWDDKIIVEPFIKAREIECSVTGNEIATAYTPGEIIPSHEFYDYDAKYIDPDGAALQIPADIDANLVKEVRKIATKAYQALDLTGLARVDFFLDKETDKLYLNEVNTIPGFTSISMFPKLCEASGLPYRELLETLFSLAIKRFNKKKTSALENLTEK